MRLRFADVVVDTAIMQIERDGCAVPVEPQVFAVLVHLLEHRDRLVTKHELLDEIWRHRFVSDSALSSRIKSARQAIGDNGRDQRLIRTVHGQGFRFVGEVRADAGDGGGVDADLAAQPRPSPAAELLAALRLGEGRGLALVAASGHIRQAAVDEVVDAADAAGVLVGRGSCAANLQSFRAVAAAFDEWLQRRPELATALSDGCRAELAAALVGAGPSVRQRLFVAAGELVRAASASGGAVLAFDDVHLLDRATVELVEHIVRAARRSCVAVVVSHRPGADLRGDVASVELAGADDGGAHLPQALIPVLARAAALDLPFDVTLLAAVTGLDRTAAQRAIAMAEAEGVVSVRSSAYELADADLATELAATVTHDDRRELLRSAIAVLQDGDAGPEILARLHDRLGDGGGSAPHHLAAARAAAALDHHGEVLAHTAIVDTVTDPTVRTEMIELRADALEALGDREAIRRYRELLRAAPSERAPWIRVRLARAHLAAGDVIAAGEVMAGVEPTGAPTDVALLLVRGMLAYYENDLGLADELATAARGAALAPGAPAQALDVIALQGMIAHSRGQWFDRLRHELRATAGSSEIASTVFDSHLCVSQYLLYGPTGQDDVARFAGELRRAAEHLGARRPAAFAATLEGEARLLAGDLVSARALLESSVMLHRELGADTGTAHSLQRLAEVELAEGDRARAEELCRDALALARWSPLSRHLLQRISGTLISTAPTPLAAAAVVDDGLALLDDPTACLFCQVMFAVPAAIALAAVGRLSDAREQLAVAVTSAARWEGAAWPAALLEARAALAAAEGHHGEATQLLDRAAAGFERAGQPLDAARCRESRDG